MPGSSGWYLFLTWQYLKPSWLLDFIAHGLPATEQRYNCCLIISTDKFRIAFFMLHSLGLKKPRDGLSLNFHLNLITIQI